LTSFHEGATFLICLPKNKRAAEEVMVILTLNCRSESVAYHLFDWKRRHLLASGAIEGIGAPLAEASLERSGGSRRQRTTQCPDHRAALTLVLHLLTDPGAGLLDSPDRIAAAGHRVAHGGERFSRSVPIDAMVIDAVRAVECLAPRYIGPNLAGIEAARVLLPRIPQVAVFDTAFHQSMPRHAFIYPVPWAWYEKHGVRRYGFHGPSHLYLAKRAATLLGKQSAACNLITIHVDLGISLCAIRNGLSVDTSMGMTPIEGALMERRCGDIDPGIPAFLMEKESLSPANMEEILNQRSGLLGITGNCANRQEVLERAAAGDPRCLLAAEMEGYRLKKYIGSYIATVGSPDAILFTRGNGALEADARARALGNLDCFGIRLDSARNQAPEAAMGECLVSADNSAVKVFVVPTHEELVIAADAAGILDGNFADHIDYPYPFAETDFPTYPSKWRFFAG
jgi:acetate kinase